MQPGPTDEGLEYAEVVRQSERQAELERKAQIIAARSAKTARKNQPKGPTEVKATKKQGVKRPFGVSISATPSVQSIIHSYCAQLLNNDTQLLVSLRRVCVADR